jgi:hypothetical protein
MYNEFDGDTLIQGELYYDNESKKKTFYIFDVLFINNKSVINEDHPTRCKSFNNFLTIINKVMINNKIDLIFQFKKFYGFDKNENNFYDNLINCEYIFRKINGKIDLETNDGFIFTPLDTPYINNITYKYKFPETMTIDFLVKFNKETNNSKYYQLYVYNENDEYIPFNYNKNYYYLRVTRDNHLFNEIYDKSIVECYYNSNLKLFTPYRIRYDKDKPNFHTVAKNVFYDIVNPITLNNLEDNFKSEFGINKINFKPPDVSLSFYEPKKNNKNTTIQKLNSPQLQQLHPLSHSSNLSEITKEKEDKEKDEEKDEEKETKEKKEEAIKEQVIQLKNKIINIDTITNKKDFKNLLNCVLYAVSPEYRLSVSKNNIEAKYIYESALEYYNNDDKKINDINELSNDFNIHIDLLKSTELSSKFIVINESNNINNNIMYVLMDNDTYILLGYKQNEYDIYIY